MRSPRTTSTSLATLILFAIIASAQFRATSGSSSPCGWCLTSAVFVQLSSQGPNPQPEFTSESYGSHMAS